MAFNTKSDLLRDFHRGDTVSLVLDILGPSSTPTPVDVTGATLTLNITSNDPRVLTSVLQKTVTPEDPPEDGRFVMELSSTETEEIPPGKYAYAFILTDSSGGKSTIVASYVNILPSFQ